MIKQILSIDLIEISELCSSQLTYRLIDSAELSMFFGRDITSLQVSFLTDLFYINKMGAVNFKRIKLQGHYSTYYAILY